MHEPLTTHEVMSEIKQLCAIRAQALKGFAAKIRTQEIDEEIRTILEHYKAGVAYRFKGIKG